jgi:hypothetical protein
MLTWPGMHRRLGDRLDNLFAAGMETTRHLDYTYSSLQSTIPSLNAVLAQFSALSNDASSLLSTFTTSSIPSLIEEHERQLKAQGQYFDKMRQKRIGDLQKRMAAAKQKVEELGQRVESVKGRVQASEGRERAGERRRRWWTTFIWRLMLGIMFLIIAGLLTKAWRRIKEEVELSIAEQNQSGSLADRLGLPDDWTGRNAGISGQASPASRPDVGRESNRADPLEKMFGAL